MTPSSRARTRTGIVAALGAAAGLLLGVAGVGARPPIVPLSPATSIPSNEVVHLGFPAISQDGYWLAYVHGIDPDGLNPTGRPQLFIQRVDGFSRRQATVGDSLVRPESPRFDTPGTTIWFTAQVGPSLTREVYRVGRDDGAPVRMTFHEGNGADPIARAVPAPDGGAWFAVGKDLLGEGLNLSGGKRVIYHVGADGAITRLSDPALNPARAAEIIGGPDDGSRVVWSARDPALGNFRSFRPYQRQSNGIVSVIGNPTGASALEGVFSHTGLRLILSSDADYTGQNGGHSPQVFRLPLDTGIAEQFTFATNSGAVHPACDIPGNVIAFESSASLLVGDMTGTRRVYILEPGQPFRRLGNGWQPAVSGDGSRVVYVDDGDSLGTNGDGSVEIFSVRASGLGRLQHTRYSPAVSDPPSISADGKKIVFASTSDLDGGNPDGSREIWIVRSDGTQLLRLTDTVAPRGCADAAISADGSQVAFACDADLVAGSNPDFNQEIFRIAGDGTGLRQVTETEQGKNYRPRLSTDGKRILFISTANLLLGAQMGKGRVALWREVTGAFTLITPTSDKPIDQLYASDDGSRAALLSTASMDGRNPTFAIRIFTATTDGSLIRAVTVTNGVQPQGLGFSPDGQWIAAANGDGRLLVLPFVGTTVDTIIGGNGTAVGYPAISNGGSVLSFVAGSTAGGLNAGDVYRMTRGGAPVGMLEHGQPVGPSVLPAPPALSGNGSALAFLMTGSDTLNPDGSREVFAASFTTTAVRWLSASIARDGTGAVRLDWAVTADADHAGFRIERAPTAGGPWHGIEGAILAQGDGRFAFTDGEESADEAWYRIVAIDRAGQLQESDALEAPPAPERLLLSVRPNPSDGPARIAVVRSAPGRNRLIIFSVTGRRVRLLADEVVPAGRHEYIWDGADDAGHPTGGGIYFVKADGGGALRVVRRR